MGPNELPPTEITAVFLIWIGGVLYSIYKVAVVSNSFSTYNYVYKDLDDGWSFIGRRKDNSDNEWYTALTIMQQVLPWIVLHSIVSECLRRLYIKAVPYWQILISLFFILYSTGLVGLIIIITQPVLTTYITKFKSKTALWICCLVNIILISRFNRLSIQEKYLELMHINEFQHYMLLLSLCWINLRCLSYHMDSINIMHSADFWQLLAYCIYLPTMVLGPFILYADFEKSQKSYNPPLYQSRFKGLLCSFIRFGFWTLFTEFFLHLIYVNAMTFQPQMVKKFDIWTLYGFGYCMGQFFHLKYVVIYGFSTSISKFDNIPVPLTPKCIGRIHLYSDMWKYFDGNLHKFLVRYIYVPTLRTKSILNKLFSSFLCFMYIYIFHGGHHYILVWALLNFVGIALENIFTYFCNENKYIDLLSTNWQQRLSSLIAAPLLAMSAVSNFYFFAGITIGNIFMDRIFNGTLLENLVVIFFLYSACQVSSKVKVWENISSKKKNINSKPIKE